MAWRWKDLYRLKEKIKKGKGKEHGAGDGKFQNGGRVKEGNGRGM